MLGLCGNGNKDSGKGTAASTPFQNFVDFVNNLFVDGVDHHCTLVLKCTIKWILYVQDLVHLYLGVDVYLVQIGGTAIKKLVQAIKNHAGNKFASIYGGTNGVLAFHVSQASWPYSKSWSESGKYSAEKQRYFLTGFVYQLAVWMDTHGLLSHLYEKMIADPDFPFVSDKPVDEATI